MNQVLIIVATAIVVAALRFTVHTPHDLALDWTRSYEALVHLWAGYLLAVVFFRTSIQTAPTASATRWLAGGAVLATTSLEVVMWATR